MFLVLSVSDITYIHIHVCTYVPTCIVLFTEVVYADVDQPIYANTDAIPKPKPVR